jgi:NDP-sugar pyrophosphorylase family protein
MKAMVLAAGLGTRLRPLTNERPKGLVELGSRTLLEITLSRLRQAGVTDAIVNVHHHAEQVVGWLQAHDLGLRVELSREDVLLDTGGGLKKAGWFFLEDGSDEPFLLHNVDVISTIDFGRMLAFHRQQGALATLAVQARRSSRYLLFDSELRLCGRRNARDQKVETVRRVERPADLAFTGIHVISPRLLRLWKEDGVFSIIDTYLRLARDGETIVGFRADEYYWRDVGTAENLRLAEEDVRAHRVNL